jgi:hypothetical protein
LTLVSCLWDFWWYWGLNSGLTLTLQVFYHLSHSTSPLFVLGNLKMGSCKIFAQASLEPQFS